MKHKFLKIALAGLAAVTFGLALTGCSGSNAHKYDYLVTFDYNVQGIASLNESVKYLGVNENSLIVMQPGSSNFTAITVPGYFNEGWYLPQTDSNNQPLKDENGRVLLDLNKPWDFATDRVTSDITLYANLLKRTTLTISGGDEDLVFEDTPGAVKDYSDSKPTKNGYTFVGLYYDTEFEQPFSWPYTFQTEGETVYAKFLEGNWAVVSDASSFMSAVVSNQNIYLQTDIDFTDTKWTHNRTYNNEIMGNNRKITGISCNWEGTGASQFGLFGLINEKAYIHDITFEQVKIDFTAIRNPSSADGYLINAFAWEIKEGARIENVTVTGTVTAKRGAQATMSEIKLNAICPENKLGANTVKNDCDFSGIQLMEE